MDKNHGKRLFSNRDLCKNGIKLVKRLNFEIKSRKMLTKCALSGIYTVSNTKSRLTIISNTITAYEKL